MDFPISSFQELDTPFYFYNLPLLRRTLAELKKSLTSQCHVHYALKANNNPTIVGEIAKAGIGADCVSGGEVRFAKEIGITPEKIVYSGVGKTDREIELAIEENIGCFNVESVPELENINDIALRLGKKANVALRINPDIDAHTHRFITTGTLEDQFGIPSIYIESVVEQTKKLPGLNLKGLHFHIGSQLTDMTPYRMLVEKVNAYLKLFRSKGVEFKTINVGGGLGIDYDNPDQHPIPDFENYFSVFKNLELNPQQELHFELGRSIVAQCGSLISRVLYIKDGVDRQFAIVDAGFTELIRPALYGAHHQIQRLTGKGENTEKYDVVGPICESTDCFARSVELPQLKRGDIVAFRSAGAYGEAMASCYNMRPLVSSYFEN